MGSSRGPVEEQATAQVAADERRLNGTGARRTSVSLRSAWASFWRHPSPYLIGGGLLLSLSGRVVVGGGERWELAIPVVLIAAMPLIEWTIHVVILHWRPRQIARIRIDSLLARKHREHHADPRDVPLVFIPWPVFLWLLPGSAVVAWLAMPTAASSFSLLASVMTLLFAYEWTHYLMHTEYRPRSRPYRALWRNHRLHHYKNENYWFTVTSSGTADRLLGTYPDPADVPTSPTVRKLYG